MTAPDETQMTHCRDCAHRLGSGCGCECCPWAGEAVRAAAEAIGHGHPSVLDEAIARDAVQAMLPVVWVAAVAAERERLAREGVYLMHHCFERGEEFGVFARQEDAEAAADRRAKGNPGALIQVLGCAVIGAESAPDPPWVQALGERANPADPLRAPGA